MSQESAPKEKAKRRSTSLPLLIGFVILGVVGYYTGPTIMTYAMLLQEKWIASANQAKDMRSPLPPNAKTGSSIGGPTPPSEFDAPSATPAPGDTQPEGENKPSNEAAKVTPETNATTAAPTSTSPPPTSTPSSVTPKSTDATPNHEELFAKRDTNSNGKIDGDEITEGLRSRMAQVDKDMDGTVSKEEYMAAVQARNSSGGGSGATPPTASAPPNDKPVLPKSDGPVDPPK